MATDPDLPAHPHPEWYRKAAKRKLDELRRSDPGAKLADAQRTLAREHGFPSWRKLIAEVESRFTAEKTAELFEAIRHDRRDAVERLLGAAPRLVEARGPGGETPLHAAAEVNDPDTIRILLAHGADPDATYGGSGHTALSWALTTMAYEAAGALLRGGVKADLFCAAGLGRIDDVRAFFDPEGRVNPDASRTGSSRYDANGRRLPCPPEDARGVASDALYIACRNARAPVARFLLAQDVDVSFRAFMGASLLHWAHFGGSSEIVAMLLAAGADPAVRDPEYGCTPRAFGICAPASWGLLRLVVERLASDPTLARIDEGRGTPLHEAARSGDETVVQALLICGADRLALDREGKTPLERALEQGHESLRPLIEPRDHGSAPRSPQ